MFMVALPNFTYLWGAMRAFQPDTRAEDPFAGACNQTWEKFQNILTNNTEQLVIFIPTILSVATLADTPAEWSLVPTVFYTYTLGRWLFGAGYFVPTISPTIFYGYGSLVGWGRSLGMNFTLYPLNIALAYCAWKMGGVMPSV